MHRNTRRAASYAVGLRHRARTLVMPLMLGVSMSTSLGGQPPERIDYLTFAQGAIPLSISPAAVSAGVTMDKALASVDGNLRGYTLSLKMQSADGATEIT